MFNSRTIQTDVTCIEIFKEHLLVGIGGYLHIHKLPENELIQKTSIFEGQNIFGIKPNYLTHNLLIFGGKHVAITPLKDQKETTCSHLSDWVLDAKWVENYSKFVTVFMHNKITLWSESFSPEISVKCEERCILYSAHICYDIYEQLIILSGTVFSEVLLWKPFCVDDNFFSPVLKRFKQHKGVIFSIDFHQRNGLICTASDDRSAILWKINDIDNLPNINPTNCSAYQVTNICQVYGHLSRIFRCLVLDDCFITAGEDSLINIWTFEGANLRKIEAHQGGSIWSLCYDNRVIYSGGNDGAILAFNVQPKIVKDIIKSPLAENSKTIGILKSGNYVCLSEKAILYLLSNNNWVEIAKHSDLLKYSIMQISPCRNLVALAGYQGQIYIYQEMTKENLMLRYQYYLKARTRIFSFHWLNCKTFLVSSNGKLSMYIIYKDKVNFVQNFNLPVNKEPWPTCACILETHVIIGDRKGNIYNYKTGTKNFVNCIKKAHSYLGVTNLYSKDNKIVSLGKDGFVKRYQLKNDGTLECIDSNKTKLSWLCKLATIKEESFILSFSGNSFVISDFKFQRIVFEVICGGGHRSWDFFHQNEDNVIFIFIKQNLIHSVQFNLQEVKPYNIREGFHIREINCLKIVNNNLIISGGEDTMLRLSVVENGMVKILQCLKIHLSSIRAIEVFGLGQTSNEFLLVTGGGRAQIICWHLFINDFSCTEKFNFYEAASPDQPETRIMDLSVTRLENSHIFIFAGYSDGFIKMFKVSESFSLEYINSFLYSHNSITKVVNIKLPVIELLGAMGTSGILSFWHITDIFDKPKEVFSRKIHQSGITSVSYLGKDNRLFILTGGDDNCVTLSLFNVTKTGLSQVSYLKNRAIHCAQITGACLLDNYFITSSIDQRIIINKWDCVEDQILFKMLKKYNTVVADPQGLYVSEFNSPFLLNICVYGNGFENLDLHFNNKL